MAEGNKQTTPLDPNPLDPKSDLRDASYAYVVAGGYGMEGKPLNSVEVFDKTTNSWIQLSPMKKSRAEASTVIYNGQILVTGGICDNDNIVSSIEQFTGNPNLFVPPSWSYFPVNLPKALRGHRTVVYNDKMFVIGGYDEEKEMYSDIIYEIQLRFPFNTKMLATLPSSVRVESCGVVLSNDKLLIFGGYDEAKVTMYDITKNEFQKLAGLGYGLCNMATVKMGENVFFRGHSRKYYVDGKSIFGYNIQRQTITKLPPMNDARSECCAVVDGNSLVVMGGNDQNDIPLNSVEALDFKTSTWRDLPPMKEARRGFVAEIV